MTDEHEKLIAAMWDANPLLIFSVYTHSQALAVREMGQDGVVTLLATACMEAVIWFSGECFGHDFPFG